MKLASYIRVLRMPRLQRVNLEERVAQLEVTLEDVRKMAARTQRKVYREEAADLPPVPDNNGARPVTFVTGEPYQEG